MKLKLLALLLLGLIAAAWAVSGVDTLECSATATPDSWTLSSGADKVSAVALPDDDATSEVKGNALRQFYELGVPTTPDGATVDSVVAVARMCAQFDDVWLKLGLAIGANVSQSDSFLTAAAYAPVDCRAAISRPGGGSWSDDDLPSLQAYLESFGVRSIYVTTFYVKVYYTEGGAPAAAKNSFFTVGAGGD